MLQEHIFGYEELETKSLLQATHSVLVSLSCLVNLFYFFTKVIQGTKIKMHAKCYISVKTHFKIGMNVYL